MDGWMDGWMDGCLSLDCLDRRSKEGSWVEGCLM